VAADEDAADGETAARTAGNGGEDGRGREEMSPPAADGNAIDIWSARPLRGRRELEEAGNEAEEKTLHARGGERRRRPGAAAAKP
jgi:hypothetical protein